MACQVMAGADPRPCPDGLAEVTGTAPEDVATACRAASQALAQLHQCSITPDHTVRLRIVQELPAECPDHALAYFDARADLVTIPTYVDCVRLAGPGGRLGEPMTPALYRSLLVHEITHAVVSQTGTPGASSRVTHEYLAYAMQFTLMEPELRRRILERYPVRGPVERSHLSELYLDLSPPRFAVKAYRHFTAAGNGCAFARKLLAGARTLPSGSRR